MRKFFLIPLLTLVCSVMAWGSEIVVNDFATLKTQLSASGTADVVKLGQDIAYATNGSDLLNIERSLTLDGQGHSIVGWGQCNVGASIKNVTLAINHAGSADANLDVVIERLNISYPGTSGRSNGIASFDGIHSLSMSKVNVGVSASGASFIALLIAGVDANGFDLTIEDSYLASGTGTYPVYILKPIAAEISNTTIDGWCALYFKNQHADYGNTPGSRGSVVTATNCTFNTQNIHNTATNGFAAFPIEDDGITLNLINCSMNAQKFGQQSQSMISLQWKSRTSGFQKVTVNISGDNTHVYNVDLSSFALTGWNTNDDEHVDTYVPSINVPFEFNISGGTFTVDPRDIEYHTYVDGTTFNVEHPFIDPEKYAVKEVSQGGNIVYRVVKKAAEKEPGVLYDLNDNVQSQGDGQNPTTSFELSDGSAMTLDQPTTKAGYVEVSNATTVTVANNQTLVINNGLDVQGTSAVTAKPGSALVIGEGGIVTESSANIVVEANQNGAASLIMDPAITVNQTPELTVKMTAKQIGRDSYGDYYWHRFAMPVQHIDTWTKEGALAPAVTYPTHLYGWSYDSNDWIKLAGGVSEMVAFKGYTLTLASEEISGHENELLDVTYVFKGNLAGNTNNALQFSHEGYNFFGNSYTGYISIAKLVEQITNDSQIQGTVWVWVGQGYEDISLNILAENPGFYDDELKEIAPMHTFVLKQNGTENASTTINYADAIWGNPRYGHSALPAPRRRTNSENDAMMRVVVTAANGQKDAVRFVEGANFSDAFENGYDASKFMNANNINVFATVNGEEFGTVATDNLGGKTITINTNSELAYTISFTNVNNEDYVLRDNVTGQVINIEEGATYEFAAQPNSTIAGRFEIVGRAQMPTAIENTEVKANVKGIYTIMGQYLGEDFDILPAGVYVVDGVKIVK